MKKSLFFIKSTILKLFFYNNIYCCDKYGLDNDLNNKFQNYDKYGFDDDLNNEFQDNNDINIDDFFNKKERYKEDKIVEDDKYNDKIEDEKLRQWNK